MGTLPGEMIEPPLPAGYALPDTRPEEFATLANDRRLVEDYVLARTRAATEKA